MGEVSLWGESLRLKTTSYEIVFQHCARSCAIFALAQQRHGRDQNCKHILETANPSRSLTSVIKSALVGSNTSFLTLLKDLVLQPTSCRDSFLLLLLFRWFVVNLYVQWSVWRTQRRVLVHDQMRINTGRVDLCEVLKNEQRRWNPWHILWTTSLSFMATYLSCRASCPRSLD